MDQNPVELLKSILNAAERHPNAKVSKLIKCFEDEKTPQNIALLLIELAEHPEFSTDITISLKYYLDCFKELFEESTFAEAGIVLYNSSRIYAKRVDQIHHEIEKLILSLSNVENTEQKNTDIEATQNTVKVKRGKKRTLEEINGTVEADMSTKRFKKILNNKRFEIVTAKRNIHTANLLQDPEKSIKSYIPQSTWQHSVIQDFDYEDEVDSKKNYKLFTYHLEHRYNTLIPDINFKMYFKIKDFINGDCDDSELPESWPPLSDAYIEQFLDLEDVILIKEGHLGKARKKNKASRLADSCLYNNIKNHTDNTCSSANTTTDSGIDLDSTDFSINSQTQQTITENVSMQITDSETSICDNNSTLRTEDSGIEMDTSVQSQPSDESQLSLSGESLNTSDTTATCNISAEMYDQMVKDSSALRNEVEVEVEKSETTEKSTESDAKLFISSNSNEDSSETIEKTEKDDPTLLDCKFNQGKLTATDPTLLAPFQSQEEDLSTLKIILPHLSDEGIFFSELDEQEKKKLSPAVVAQDVFGCIKDKSNIVIKVDETIEQLFKIREPSDEILSIPLFERPNFSLRLNILKIPLKYFNKQSRFKLGAEFEVLKKDRLKKYVKRSSLTAGSSPKKLMRIAGAETREHISPPSSPSYEPDWLGFPEENSMDKNRTLSRDSGISVHQTDKENIEDFVESSDLLNSTPKLQSDAQGDSIPVQENLNVPGSLNSTPTLQSGAEGDSIPVCTDKLVQNTDEANNPAVEPPVSPSVNPTVEPTVNPLVIPEVKTDSTVSIDNQCTQIDELSEGNRVRKKVHDWHNHLQPILACSRERHHFDVFALGTEIMTQFDRSDLFNNTVSFKNVMEEKDESLISRYFLSMLLLANQGNLLIDVQNQCSNKPSELHDIRLKLKSRKRNVVSLEDNIGLRTPPASITQVDEQPAIATVRTLKSLPEVPQMDDRDSGIAMSEASNVI